MNAILKNITQDRKTYIGSSDAAAILGVSPWKSPFALYQEKIGEYQEEITPTKQKLFNRGKRWEPIVIEMLVDELEDRGHDVTILAKNQRYIDHQYGFLAAEIDLELLLDGQHVNGEMKTVHPFAAKDWGEQDTDEIPIYYTSQVLHGQMVTRRNKTIVAALIGADDLRVHVVDRDDEMIDIIRNKEIEFWSRIQNREAPEPTTTEDINRLYRFDSGSAIEADSELLELIGEASNKKSELKAIETRLEVLVTQIKSRMGEAAFLLHNGQKLATWKTNKPSEKTDWKGFAIELMLRTNGAISKDNIEEMMRRFTTIKPGARPFLLK